MNNKTRSYSIIYRVATVFTMCILLAACATVPLTERKSLRLIPSSELLSLSDEQYAKVLPESKLSTNSRQVQMVTQCLAAVQGGQDRTPCFVVQCCVGGSQLQDNFDQRLFDGIHLHPPYSYVERMVSDHTDTGWANASVVV